MRHVRRHRVEVVDSLRSSVDRGCVLIRSNRKKKTLTGCLQVAWLITVFCTAAAWPPMTRDSDAIVGTMVPVGFGFGFLNPETTVKSTHNFLETDGEAGKRRLCMWTLKNWASAASSADVFRNTNSTKDFPGKKKRWCVPRVYYIIDKVFIRTHRYR